jgi:hypothetical protein
MQRTGATVVSTTHLRAYFGLFGVIGAGILLSDLDSVGSFISDQAVAAVAKLWLVCGQLAQCLVCLVYVYVAMTLPSLLRSGSALPPRLVKLSMAIAAVVTCYRLSLVGLSWILEMLLPLLFNMALNLPLLRMVREAGKMQETERERSATEAPLSA